MTRDCSAMPSLRIPRSTRGVATKTINAVMSPLEHIAVKLKEIQTPR